jgi:dynactin complex subunit
LLTRVDELQSAYTDAARDVAELVETNQRLRELLLDVENASTIELAERIRKELDK